MEDSSSRNCKRSDAGFDEDAWDSSTAAVISFSKKMKKTDGDDKLEFAELKLSSSLSKNSDEIRRRYCSSAEGKAAVPATSNSSSAAGRLLVDGDFCSAAADSHAPGVCCFSNAESSELDVKESEFGPADLEAKSYETESSSTCINNKLSREASPSSQFSVDSSEEKDMADSSTKAETTMMEKPKTITTASSQSAPPPATSTAASEGSAKESPSQEELDDFFTAAENEKQKRFAEKYNFDVVKDVPLEGRYQWVRLKP
ncbi:unnamed protein product [Linum tenue]|uniref:Cyclin-dependent kinase inhibitor domain-containing protein n=1 Tax=Linum tenue TaxID=586396 RepID=A0AAV0HDW5_9ROSI|nr:unnamed protein product [Linum tenue]